MNENILNLKSQFMYVFPQCIYFDGKYSRGFNKYFPIYAHALVLNFNKIENQFKSEKIEPTNSLQIFVYFYMNY